MNNQPNIETNIAKNIPTIDYTTCIDTIKKLYGDNNYHVASIIFNRNLLSSITDGALNTSSVYSLIFDTEKNIYSSDECKKLNVYFPDPAVNDILNDNIKSLKSLNVNYYNQSDSFYNDRCVQFSNDEKQIDVTLNERRLEYMSHLSISCINYSPDSFRNISDCSFTGLSYEGYVVCTCEGQLGEITIVPSEPKPMKKMEIINIEVISCPVFKKTYTHPKINIGIIYTITTILPLLFLSILFIRFFNDKYLISGHKTLLHYYDSVTYIQNLSFSDLEKCKQNSNENEVSKGSCNVLETEKDKINNITIFSFNKKQNPATSANKLRDYFKFSPQEKITKDHRSFLKYFWDQLVNTHVFLLMIYKKSLLTSPIIRLYLLVFYVDTVFLLNIMCYTDDQIENRNRNYEMVIA